MAVYLIRVQDTDYVKIGYASRDPMSRLADMQTGCPYQLVLEAFAPSGTIADETALHKKLSAYRHRLEWFHIPLTLAARHVVEQVGEDLTYVGVVKAEAHTVERPWFYLDSFDTGPVTCAGNIGRLPRIRILASLPPSRGGGFGRMDYAKPRHSDLLEALQFVRRGVNPPQDLLRAAFERSKAEMAAMQAKRLATIRAKKLAS